MSDRFVDSATAYPPSRERLPDTTLREGRYELRFARSSEELDRVLKLRFEIFNLELGEGFETSFETRRDRDEFDAVCHHLMVLEASSGEVVGTYRMQTHAMAEVGIGFYSAGIFDLTALPPEIANASVELGRACIALEHRNTQVLFLLWRGLALYAVNNQKRYCFGCSSLTSQDPAEGWAVMRQLEQHGQLHPDIRIAPLPEFECLQHAADPLAKSPRVKIPKLFRIYLRHGAKICGPPAIDRQFKTIDFFGIIDLGAITERQFRTFFG